MKIPIKELIIAENILNQIIFKLMKQMAIKELKAMRGGTYDSPQCAIVDLHAEGVLCSSFEKLGNEFEFDWDTNKEG